MIVAIICLAWLGLIALGILRLLNIDADKEEFAKRMKTGSALDGRPSSDIHAYGKVGGKRVRIYKDQT